MRIKWAGFHGRVSICFSVYAAKEACHDLVRGFEAGKHLLVRVHLAVQQGVSHRIEGFDKASQAVFFRASSTPANVSNH